MADSTPQNFGNHVRFHPPFHYFLAPGSAVLLILTIVNAVRHYERLDAWILVLMGLLFFVAVFLVRTNPLKVQDRLIRLEERLRLEDLAPADLAPRLDDLTEGQLVALRFASDGEVAGLAAKAVASNMKPAEIKKAIVVWRADTFRV
jgi:hypothetical protein